MPRFIIVKSKKLRELIEDYRTTVDALLCFVSLTTWDAGKKRDGSQHSFGRHMHTSSKNPISPNQTQTPDLVVQVDKEEAYVVEAKIDLPKEQKYWGKEIQQLQKYDDDLAGWWTEDEKINQHDIVLLIDISRSQQFAKYAKNLNKKSSLFHRPIAFVGFSRYQRVDENILFQLEWGRISNKPINHRLEQHVPVPLEKVIASYGSRKFYDDKPQPEYLMEVMWSHLFTEKKSATQYSEILKAWPFDIDINEITSELQKLFGNYTSAIRDDSHPCISWVRDAIDLFAALGLAVQKSDDVYEIRFKEFRTGDLIERFSKARSKANQVEAKKLQGELKLEVQKN
jgi:hypothetical protein